MTETAPHAQPNLLCTVLCQFIFWHNEVWTSRILPCPLSIVTATCNLETHAQTLSGNQFHLSAGSNTQFWSVPATQLNPCFHISTGCVLWLAVCATVGAYVVFGEGEICRGASSQGNIDRLNPRQNFNVESTCRTGHDCLESAHIMRHVGRGVVRAWLGITHNYYVLV